MSKVLFALLGALVITSPGSAAAGHPECEEARCAVQAEINRQCPCDQAKNHGQHVRCVAHVVQQMSRQGDVPTWCKGKIKRCAARSTCGKPGFVACQIPIDVCENIDTLTGMGTCANAPDVACMVDLDCGSRCRTKRSAELCTDRGGTPGTGSCCAACTTTPG